MRYKLCKFCEIAQGIHFGQIWVKISILGVLHPCRCTDGGEIWHGGGDRSGTEEGTFGPLLRAKFHPHRWNVSPLRGEKPQNRPLSKLNTGRFALRAMLPVITDAIYTTQRLRNFTTASCSVTTRCIKMLDVIFYFVISLIFYYMSLSTRCKLS